MKDKQTRIVSVSSSSKKAGKSSLASHLVGELQADCGLKVSCGGEHGTGEPLVSDPDIISIPDTDTGSLVEAGARTVIWVNAGKENLARELDRALSMFPAGGFLVVEGNSVLEHLDPDFAVFIMNVPVEEFKPSAHLAISRADLVLTDLGGGLRRFRPEELEEQLHRLTPGAHVIFFEDKSGRMDAYRDTVQMIREKLTG